MSTLLERCRERDFQATFLDTVRTLSDQEIYELLRDMARERVAECNRMIQRTQRILGRDFKERWAA